MIDMPIMIPDIENLLSKHAIKEIFGIKIDLTRINDKRYLVRKAFQILTNPDRPGDPDSVQWLVLLVRSLENFLNTQFENGRDFKRKIESYLKDYEVRKGSAADRIKKARKKRKLTQKQLAELLGFKTHVTIVNYEKGKRYPGEKVFEWLKEVGV